MKKFFYIACVAVLCLTSCHKSLWAEIDDLKNEYTDLATRVAKLEELCKEINTNVSAIQTIINVQQTGDYITNITPVIKDGKTIGYTITFAKHEAITIYNGEDGRDGANGVNGTDGYTPVIGVAQDTDGKYYWTLDGHWMTDSANNKMPVTGRDGRDGIDGANGTNGTNGQDGQDGITPQFKIEAEYWYVSYDNGATWTQLGKATGNDGQNGTDGTNGQDGDSMFQSVTQDENNVYFTLADGTVITVGKGDGVNAMIINGTIMAEFSVSATSAVYFSQGNLQYQASTNTWRFAEHQYDRIGDDNSYISPTYNGWIDLFGWGTGANPTNATATHANYQQFTDWGANSITNGGNIANEWHTLSKDEWEYLLSLRPNASSLWFRATVADIPGAVLLPDNWLDVTWNSYLSIAYKTGEDGFLANRYTAQQWRSFESFGAVFLPLCGYRSGTELNHYQLDKNGWYWSCTRYNNEYVYPLHLEKTNTGLLIGTLNYLGASVRLVKNVE